MPVRSVQSASQAQRYYGSGVPKQGRVKYSGSHSIRTRQLVATHTMIITSGVPQQLPAIRVLPGMEAIVFCGHLAGANDHIYLAKHNAPRAAANTPGPGAIILSGNGGTGGNSGPTNLDGDMLSRWFADSDGSDSLNIMVYENRDEQLV